MKQHLVKKNQLREGRVGRIQKMRCLMGSLLPVYYYIIAGTASSRYVAPSMTSSPVAGSVVTPEA